MKGTLDDENKAFPKSLTKAERDLAFQMGTLLMTSEFYRGGTSAIVNSMAELDLIKYGKSTFSASFDTLNKQSPYIGAPKGGGAEQLRQFSLDPNKGKFQANKARIIKALAMRINKPAQQINLKDLNARLNTRLGRFGIQGNYFQ